MASQTPSMTSMMRAHIRLASSNLEGDLLGDPRGATDERVPQHFPAAAALPHAMEIANRRPHLVERQRHEYERDHGGHEAEETPRAHDGALGHDEDRADDPERDHVEPEQQHHPRAVLP